MTNKSSISIFLLASLNILFCNFLHAQQYVHQLAKLETIDNPVAQHVYSAKQMIKNAAESADVKQSLKDMGATYVSGEAAFKISCAFSCTKYRIAEKLDKNINKALWAPELLACDVMGTGEKKPTVLNKAILEQDVSLVKALLRAGASPHRYNTNPKAKEKYPLIEAALRGNSQIVKLLLDAGADPNWSEPTFGRTALFYAKTPEVIEILVEYKAAVNHRDKYGLTPFDKQLDIPNNFPVLDALKRAGGLESRQLTV